MAFPISELIRDRSAPVTAMRTEALLTALRRMRDHDFTQLPVVDDGERPLGLVSVESALRAHGAFGLPFERMRVAEAQVRAATVREDAEIFEALDRLKEQAAVLVVRDDGCLSGILTSYDTTEYFRRRAEDMMYVEDVETRLKEVIRLGFQHFHGDDAEDKLRDAIVGITPSEVRARGRTRAFEDLTFSEYMTLFLHADTWHVFEPVFPLDTAAIHRLLDGVRITRNALAHFRREIPSDERDHLRLTRDWLEQHRMPSERQPEVARIAAPPIDLARSAATDVDQTAAAEESLGNAPDGPVPPTAEAGTETNRYARLAEYLQGLQPDQGEVIFTFSQVEEIMGAALPASAREHRGWWANDSVSHAQSKEWLAAGWRVDVLDLDSERVVFSRMRERERAYKAFFDDLLNRFRDAMEVQAAPRATHTSSWLGIGRIPIDGPAIAWLNVSFSRYGRFRVEVYIDTGSQARNKALFEALRSEKDAIEEEVGEPLSWERLDARRASRVAIYRDGSIDNDPEGLSELKSWAIEAAQRLGPAMRDRLERLAALQA